ncbi:MAG TPA: hypothetical protein VLX68_03505 [Chitinivibrionales bacterium]|nr:hypothetical protein [Chitinivibrionales bacterium]
MGFTHYIVLFDASAVLLMVILIYLSRPLGVALKIPPWYRLLYVTSIVIAVTAISEIIGSDLGLHIPQSIPMLLRVVSAVVAFLVCLKYWNWAFSEFFRK